MRSFCISLFLASTLFLSGCMSIPSASPDAVKSVENPRDVLLFLGPEMKVEPVFFPRYLLMSGVEINRHGRIPFTHLAGAGLLVRTERASAEARFIACLEKRGWKIIQQESGDSWFRFIATHQDEWLELRGVRGETTMPVFLLYSPVKSPSF